MKATVSSMIDPVAVFSLSRKVSSVEASSTFAMLRRVAGQRKLSWRGSREDVPPAGGWC